MSSSELFSVQDKVIAITGGSSGIGLMAAESLSRAGAKIVMIARNTDVCEARAFELDSATKEGECVFVAADIVKAKGIQTVFEFIKKRFGKLDVLINNAGRTWGAKFDEFPVEAWESVLSVNLTAPFMLMQKLAPLLQAAASADNPSRIVNMGSVVGSIPVSNQAYSYGASKSAIHHLTRMLANDLAHRNILVNALAPGPFPSKMMAYATSGGAETEALKAATLSDRLGQPQDIEGALLFLCSRASAYMTGAIIPLDGGIHVKV